MEIRPPSVTVLICDDKQRNSIEIRLVIKAVGIGTDT